MYLIGLGAVVMLLFTVAEESNATALYILVACLALGGVIAL